MVLEVTMNEDGGERRAAICINLRKPQALLAMLVSLATLIGAMWGGIIIMGSYMDRQAAINFHERLESSMKDGGSIDEYVTERILIHRIEAEEPFRREAQKTQLRLIRLEILVSGLYQGEPLPELPED